MKKHDCEKYRFTAEKYVKKEEGDGVNWDKRIFVSWCSLCGKKIRAVLEDLT